MSRSPPPPPRHEPERDRFSRSNFAPLPNRHDPELLAVGSAPTGGGAMGGGDRYIPAPREREREPLPPRDRERDREREREPLPMPPREREPLPMRERDYQGGPGGGGREWDSREYEREREMRGEGRGRRPPPHWEEDFDRPKRRRSPSPSYASHRPRRFSPEPQGMALPDPASLPHQLGFKQFADWFRVTHPSTAKADEEEFRRYKAGIDDGLGDVGKERVGMGKRYERYRKEYTSRQLYSLYLMHRTSPWFTERYSHLPEDEAERKRVQRQGRVPTVQAYLGDLKAGKFDSVSFDQTDDDVKQSSGTRRYSELEEPEGLDRVLGATGADESGKLEVPPKPNQVFVKSVPPTISRKDLEQLFASCDGFQYLALTEPSVKKAFHRVAWAQYADGVDVAKVVKKLDESKIDNFTFHMGVNTAATVGRVRTAPAVASTLDRLVKDGEAAKALAIKLEENLVQPAEEVKGETEGKEGDIKMEGGDGDKKGEGMKERGSEVVEETIRRVLGKEGLAGEEEGRSEEGKIKRAKLILDHWISYLRNGLSTCYYCVAPMCFAEELQRKCVGHVRLPIPPKDDLDTLPEDTKMGEGNGEDGNGDLRAELEKAGEEVDMEDRDRRDAGAGTGAGVGSGAAGVDVSGRREGESKSNRERGRGRGQSQEERWEEYLDYKLGPMVGEVDVVEYGGKDMEEETKRLTAPMIKQEETHKYRCKECNKLFKAPEFVMKHIVVKHGETVQARLDEYTTFNNFVLDPQHLQPTLQVPAAIDDALPPMAGSAPLLGATAFNPAAIAAGGNLSQQQQQQQMMMMMMQMQQAMMAQMAGSGAAAGAMGMGNPGRELAGRMGGFAGGAAPGGGGSGGRGPGPVAREPLPPPPPGAEDPRAKRGRVSYMDLDEAGGGGDGGLPY